MIHHFYTGAIAGVLSAASVALLELAGLTSEAPRFHAAWISVGLLLPIGAIAGLILVPLSSVLSRRRAARRLPAADAALQTAGAVLATGIWTLTLIAIVYQIIFLFITTFHHPGLIALSLTAVLGGVFTLAFLLWTLTAALLRRGLRRMGRPALCNPTAALALVLAMAAVTLLPPMLQGAEARGPFAFIGLLRRDGLRILPPVEIAAIALLSYLIARPASRLPGRPRRIAAGAAVALAILGVPTANWMAGRNVDALDHLDRAETLSALIAGAIRKASDGNGRDDIMGADGGDEAAPAVHPGARKKPDKQLDAECPGRDLSLASPPTEQRAGQPASARPPSRPALPEDASLFLITIDSLRWDGVGFMGYHRPVSENLDALVANGTVYERAYALGSYTAQAIPPMLTGKYASELLRDDRHETRIAEEETFAAELVCDPEVRCAGIMSHFLFKKGLGWSQGFDTWTVVRVSPSGPGYIDTKYNSNHVADAAIAWLENPENTAGRFFLWTHFMDPHKEYLHHPGFPSFGETRRDRYDQEVLFTDHHIGRMLAYFQTLPASKRTIFVVTADHGEAFNEHGRWTHGKELWEEIIRVPLAVAGPGIPKKRIARQTSLIDMFPTIIDLFGRPLPQGIHGRSLLGDWVASQLLEERPVVADQPKNPIYEARRVFIKDGWKLHHLPETRGYRLYQLTDDYERGPSLVDSDRDRFEALRAEYERFLATELKAIPPALF